MEDKDSSTQSIKQEMTFLHKVQYVSQSWK